MMRTAPELAPSFGLLPCVIALEFRAMNEILVSPLLARFRPGRQQFRWASWGG